MHVLYIQLSGIIAIRNNSDLSDSPWKMSLFIIASASVCSHVANSAFQFLRDLFLKFRNFVIFQKVV